MNRDLILYGLLCLNNCRQDIGKAREILLKDLKVFESSDNDLLKQITYLFSFENFRYEKIIGVVYYLRFVIFLLQPDSEDCCLIMQRL